MKNIKYFIFAGFFAVFSQNAFADPCANPADCLTAIACGVSRAPVWPPANQQALDRIIADSILDDFQACDGFRYENEMNDFEFDGLQMNWARIRQVVVRDLNSDPRRTQYAFLVAENPWYRLGARGTTGIGTLGTVIIVAGAGCVILTKGICAKVGVGAATKTATYVGGAAVLGGAYALGSGADATARGITNMARGNVIANISGFNIPQTMSNWDGCVNIVADATAAATAPSGPMFGRGSGFGFQGGISNPVSRTDMFTRLVMSNVEGFENDIDSIYTFNKQMSNVLHRDGLPLIVNARQRDQIIRNIPRIANQNACNTGQTWQLHLYPLRIVFDIQGDGALQMSFERAGDPIEIKHGRAR